jgi:ABC-type sugar transport system substrate-binding protein
MFGYFRLPLSANTPKVPGLSRMFVVLAGAILAVSSAMILIGCDSKSTFLPPPPDGLRGAMSEDTIDVPAPGLEGASSGARSVEMILDHRDPIEIDGVMSAARTQAGIDTVRLRPKLLGDADLPSHQVELVSEAIARHPLALIVEPSDPSDTRMAEVLQKAQGDGIPVVLVNRPLIATSSNASAARNSSVPTNAAGQAPSGMPDSPRSRLLVLVAPPSFTQSARQLVASTIRNAKNAQLDPHGGAVLLANKFVDPFAHERSTAIRDALKDAGITTVEEISFSKSADLGAKLLKEKLATNSKLVLVFAIDGLSTSAARLAMSELIPDRLFVQAAFASDGNYADMTRVGDFAAVAAFAPNRVIRKAITTAVSLSQGHDMPARIEVPVEVYDSDEKSSTPQSPVYYKAKSASKKGP